MIKDSKFNTHSSIYTLAQSRTETTFNLSESAVVVGKGSDLLNQNLLKKRALNKLRTQRVVLKLIDIAKENGCKEKIQPYWNAYHCQSNLISSSDKIYGTYCKSRFCYTCLENRKAEIVNKYLPTISKWEDPHLLTLTIKSVKMSMLRPSILKMKATLKKILQKLNKRNQRKKTQKLKGLKFLECSFNPIKKTYNPHFHIIVSNLDTAEILKKEWLELNHAINQKKNNLLLASPKGQDIRRIKELDTELLDVIKYAGKILNTSGSLNKQLKHPNVAYIRAIDNIYSAFKGIRLYDRFGFNLPPKSKSEIKSRLVNNISEWSFSIKQKDWINKKTGENLSQYFPFNEIDFIIEDELNMILY